MKLVTRRPNRHLLVCINRRPATDPLGAGCGDRGDAVYQACKRMVAKHQAWGSHWVTRTYCLGQCPAIGTAATLYPAGQVLTEVTEADIPELLGLT
jgi:hypothetical protein